MKPTFVNQLPGTLGILLYIADSLIKITLTIGYFFNNWLWVLIKLVLFFCLIWQAEIGRSALNILFSDLMPGLDVWSLNMTNICTKYARCTKYQRKTVNYHNNILHTDNPGFRESFDSFKFTKFIPSLRTSSVMFFLDGEAKLKVYLIYCGYR